jgi:hypothetical protein
MPFSEEWQTSGKSASMECLAKLHKEDKNASKRQEHRHFGADYRRRLVAVQEGIVPLGRLRPNVTAQNPEESVGVYEGFYGELPMPATAYVYSATRLKSADVVPSVKTVASNASVVDRHDRLDGIISTGGRQSRVARRPQWQQPVYSSAFQRHLIGPLVNYILNDKWYIAYPAATVMLGGQHNLKWSEKVPQLPTRVSGGPGPAAMMAAPRFKSVQTVPRYSTMPTMYNTAPTQT